MTRVYYGYWLVAAAFVTQFVSVGAQNYSIGSFMVPMITELGWSRAEFILPRSVGQFVAAFTGFFVGVHVDRHGARPFMLFGMVTLTLSLFGMSFVRTLWQWVILNGVVLTVGASLIGSLVVNVTLAKWFVERRGRAIAWAAMGVSFGGIGVTPAITVFIDAYGWRAGWRAMAAGALLLTLVPALMMRRAPEDHGLHPDGKTQAQVDAGQARRAQTDLLGSMTRDQAIRTRAFYLLVIGFGLYYVNIPVILFQTVPFITDAGYSRSAGAWMILLASIPAVATKPVWGWLIDHTNPRPLAAASSAFTGVTLILVVLSVQARSEWWQYVTFLMIGVGWGGMIPMQEVIWASYFGRLHLGAVRGAALPLTLMFSAGGPLAVAYYRDVVGSYDGAMLFVGGMAILGGALLWSLPPARRR